MPTTVRASLPRRAVASLPDACTKIALTIPRDLDERTLLLSVLRQALCPAILLPAPHALTVLFVLAFPLTRLPLQIADRLIPRDLKQMADAHLFVPPRPLPGLPLLAIGVTPRTLGILPNSVTIKLREGLAIRPSRPTLPLMPAVVLLTPVTAVAQLSGPESLEVPRPSLLAPPGRLFIAWCLLPVDPVILEVLPPARGLKALLPELTSLASPVKELLSPPPPEPITEIVPLHEVKVLWRGVLHLNYYLYVSFTTVRVIIMVFMTETPPPDTSLFPR